MGLMTQRSGEGRMRAVASWAASKDVGLFRFLNHRLRCRTLDVVFPKLTHSGSAGATIGSILTMYLWGLLARRPHLIKLSFVMAVAAVVSHSLVHFLKRSVNRPRPQIRLADIRVFRVPICNYSFPSGHTAAAFAIGLPFAWTLANGPDFAVEFPWAASFHLMLSKAIMGWAYLIGISRIYLGVHYPSDVLAGAFLGTGGAMVAQALLPF